MYLKDVHKGEFINKTFMEIAKDIKQNNKNFFKKQPITMLLILTLNMIKYFSGSTLTLLWINCYIWPMYIHAIRAIKTIALVYIRYNSLEIFYWKHR